MISITQYFIPEEMKLLRMQKILIAAWRDLVTFLFFRIRTVLSVSIMLYLVLVLIVFLGPLYLSLLIIL